MSKSSVYNFLLSKVQSNQTLPEPPEKISLKITINFSDSAGLRIQKGFVSMWTTKGRRLRGYLDDAFRTQAKTITDSRTHNLRVSLGTTGASALGIPATIQLDEGRGRSRALTRPHFHLESTGNLGPGKLRQSASWKLHIKSGSSGRVSDDMAFNIKITPEAVDLEQDFQMTIAYQITVSDLRNMPNDLYHLEVDHLKTLRFQQKPAELASLVHGIDLDARWEDSNAMRTGLSKINLPVQPHNLFAKLLKKIRQRMGRAKISKILSEELPLISTVKREKLHMVLLFWGRGGLLGDELEQ
ncbi:hypothetical protein B0H19DRAFT_1058020 [Mycena capillaripes]|nr:hypothetical protein B0H19DRAFT_1058020 [Mycena capillaripes]